MSRFIQNSSRPVAGLLFFIVMGLIANFTIIQGQSYELTRAVHIPVLLETAEGLRVGAPVLVKGVEMGVLSQMDYIQLDESGFPLPWATDPNTAKIYRDHHSRIPGRTDPNRKVYGQKVLAILDLKEHVPIYPDFKIVTRYTSLISQKIVEILPGRLRPGQDPRWNPLILRYQTLQKYRQTGELPRNGKKPTLLTSNNFDDPIYLLAGVINENRRPIHKITSDLRDISGRIDTGKGTVSLLLTDDKLVRGTNDILKLVRILIQDGRTLVEANRETRGEVDFLSAYLTTIILKGAGL